MMDRIIIDDIACYAYHGVLPEEKELGQEFEVSLELGTDFTGIRDDQIEEAVDYRQAVELVKEILCGNPCRLLETLAERIAYRLLQLPGTAVNGPSDNALRLPNITNLRFAGLDSGSLLRLLDTKGVCASAGSACLADSGRASHTLKSIGLSDEAVHSSLRLSLSRLTTAAEIKTAGKLIAEAVTELRQLSR